MARATIEDVARRAGVTKSTVSHALSGKRPVSPETRQRIADAIEALSYRPNPLAQRLAAGRTGAIGLACELAAGQLIGAETAVLQAVGGALSAAGFALVLFTQPGAGAAAIRPYLESGLLDGLLLAQVQAHDERVAALCQAGLPFVMLGRTADNSGLSFVDIDIEAAVEMCVGHLVGLGHRQIAFLHEDAWTSAAAGRALQAYERACVRRRLRLLAPACASSARGVRSAAVSLLQSQPAVAALIVSSEPAAWGVELAAADLGRRVPEDLSLVSLAKAADENPLAPVTTGVDLRPAEQAAQAVALLLDLLGQAAPGDRQILLDPYWVDGETTAPVRPDAPERG